MEKLLKIRSELLIGVTVLLFIILGLGFYDVLVNWSDSNPFIAVGDVFSFNKWGNGYSVAAGIISIAMLVIAIFNVVFWTFLIFRSHRRNLLLEAILSTLGLLFVFFLVANFPAHYETRLLNDNIALFAYVSLVIVSGFVWLPLSFVTYKTLSYSTTKQRANNTAESDITFEASMSTSHENETIEEEVTETSGTEGNNVTINIIGGSETDAASIIANVTAKPKVTNIKRTTKRTIDRTRADIATRFQSTSGETRTEKDRETFTEKMHKASSDIKTSYNTIKHELLSYGLKSRVSNIGDTFRVDGRVFARITITGKSLKIFLSLSPKEYEGSSIPFAVTAVESYKEIPMVYKVAKPGHVTDGLVLIKDMCLMNKFIYQSIPVTDFARELSSL